MPVGICEGLVAGPQLHVNWGHVNGSKVVWVLSTRFWLDFPFANVSCAPDCADEFVGCGTAFGVQCSFSRFRWYRPLASTTGYPSGNPPGCLGWNYGQMEPGNFFCRAVFGVGGGFEGGPVRGGVEALVVGGGEPKFDGEFAFENAGMLVLEHETIVKLDLELGWIGAGGFGDGFVGVEELQLAAVGPGDGEWGEFIEPGELLGREVFVEFVADVGGLGFLGEGETGKGAGEAVRDGGGGERRKFQLGPNGAKEIHAGDELFHLVVEEREFEKAAKVGFGQAAAGCCGVNFALVLVVDHEVAEADEFDGGDAFVCPIEEVLDLGGEVLGEHFLDPFAFDGGGQAEKGEVFRAAGG